MIIIGLMAQARTLQWRLTFHKVVPLGTLGCVVTILALVARGLVLSPKLPRLGSCNTLISRAVQS